MIIIIIIIIMYFSENYKLVKYANICFTPQILPSASIILILEASSGWPTSSAVRLLDCRSDNPYIRSV